MEQTKVRTSNKPRLLVISTTQIASDVRISRHIRHLASEFEIYSIGYGVAPDGVRRHLAIPDRLTYLPISPASVVPQLLRRFERSSSRTPAVQMIRENVESFEVDLVLLNDVQTLPVADVLKVPFVVDMHEYAPREMEDDWRFRLLLMRYYTWLCDRYLPRAAHVVTVSPGIAKAFRESFGVNTSTVLNARESRALPVHAHESDQIKLVHSGLAAKSRCLEKMIEAVAEQERLIFDLYLVSAPRQSRTLKRLVKIASKTSNVRVREPVPSQNLPDVINNYDVALAFIPASNFSLEHGIPNKLFDSVQGRVGVLTGPSPDMAGLVEVFGFGRSTKSFDALELRELLLSLTSEEVTRLKRAADRAASILTAENESRKLAQILKNSIPT